SRRPAMPPRWRSRSRCASVGLPLQEVVGLPRLVGAGQVEVQESIGACRSRTNADDRLALDPLDWVEGRDGVIEGRDFADVRTHSPVTRPPDNLTQVGAIE